MDQLILTLALLQEPRQHRAVPPGGRLMPPPAASLAPAAAAPVRKLPEHQPAWSRAQQLEFQAALRAPEVRN